MSIPRPSGKALAASRLLPNDWWQHPLAQLAQLAPVQAFDVPEFKAAGVEVFIKREDLLCPFLGGNKLYKLYYHLRKAKVLGAKCIVSFGGAYSNHLYALAKVGAEVGLATCGIVRGDPPEQQKAKQGISPTLQDAERLGMQLIFVNRTDYKRKHTAAFQCELGLTQAGIYCIPEGGGDLRGALGMAKYWQSLNAGEAYDAVVVAAGTGASVAGVLAAATPKCQVHGILALKGSAANTQRFKSHATALARALCRYSGHKVPVEPWHLHTQFHGGGYGPATGQLMEHIERYQAASRVPLDPVYTGKMAYALVQLVNQGFWSAGTRILALHTGGLQGARGLGITSGV
jgi:1-aminocyclopropane-1-carboxylate deaminase